MFCVRPSWHLVAASLLQTFLVACGSADESGQGSTISMPPSVERGVRAIFIDQATASGLDFVHFNGMSGERYFPENVGAGAALFDYDNDGDLDLYLVQGNMLGPEADLEDALFPPAAEEPLLDRLYRNDLAVAPDGSRTLHFTDVTAESGISAPGYGMGVATADIDNDGWIDLYVTNFGPNQLFHNNGPGPDGAVTFTDVTAATGTGDRRWSVPATFIDFDRDGWLDLYVGNYVKFSYVIHRPCFSRTGVLDYCGPLAYEAEPDKLLRNLGKSGRFAFEDVSQSAGITGEYGGALGVVSADFDTDGWSDLYVANDGTPNQLWMNMGAGADEPQADHSVSFENRALIAGTAVNREGIAEASMGVDAGDVDGDGDEDLFMTHLTDETNTLYINDGQGYFEDETADSGLGRPSWTQTGFGTAFFDYDNDGWLDVFVANGAVQVIERLAAAGDPYPLDLPNQLYRNLGGSLGRAEFEEVSAAAGEVFSLHEISRGTAFGDIDNDGDTDIVLINNSGPARLLINQVGQDRPWLGLRLLDANGRDALGARVEVVRERGPSLWRRVKTDGSYASANDPRLLVGLGEGALIDRVRVFWPSGRTEEFLDIESNGYTVLREGSGDEIR